MSAEARGALRSCALAAALLAAAAHPCAAAPREAAAPARPETRAPDDGRSSPGKPQPPISIAYQLSAVPAVGVPLVVTITAHADPAYGTLTLDVRPDDGVSMRSPLATVAARPELRAWQIGVTPQTSATGRLNVLVTAEGGAGSYARSIVVPIDTAARPTSARARGAQVGERVVALSVKESVARGSR